MVQLFLLRHALHALLQKAEASHPALGFVRTGAPQVQALPGSLEDHREALVLWHRAGEPPQRLGLAAFTNALHLRDGDWDRGDTAEGQMYEDGLCNKIKGGVPVNVILQISSDSS